MDTFRAVALLAGALLAPTKLQADLVSIGYVSYDILIPAASGSPGVDAFTIGNLTGDPSLGGNNLPPTFPVMTSVTLLNVALALTSNGSVATINLGDIGPGFFSSGDLQFPDTDSFSSAVLTATLDVTDLQLADGTSFSADSSTIVANLLPSEGTTLTAGTDFTLIGVSSEATVPEPSSKFLLAAILVLLGGTQIIRRKVQPVSRRQP